MVVDCCVWIVKEHQVFVTKADFFCEEHLVLMDCPCLSEPCKRRCGMDCYQLTVQTIVGIIYISIYILRGA